MPFLVVKSPACQIEEGSRPIRELGAGPRELDRVERAVVQGLRRGLQPGDPLVPGGLRIGLVEPVDMPELLPEALVGIVRRELGEDELRPLTVRAGDPAPVGGAVVDDPRRLAEPRQLVEPDERRVEAFEGIGPHDAAEADPRRGGLAEGEQPLAVPGWDEPEGLRIGVLDARSLDERIEVADVDEARAATVGSRRDGASELLLADRRADSEDLARLDVRAVDCELAEGHVARVRVHGRRS